MKHAFFMHRKRWYHPKFTELQKILTRKWEIGGEKIKTLPIINVLILKINEDDGTFDLLII